MQIQSIKELYVMLLQDIYNGEKQLAKALTKMAEASTSPELRNAFTTYAEDAQNQTQNLQTVLKTLEGDDSEETCEAMEGLIEEADEMIDHTDEKTRDAALIASAQKIKHYEIASYGTLCALAKQLGLSDQVKPLEEALENEKEADVKLTEIAENLANQKAAA